MHNLAKNMLVEDEKLHSPKSLAEGIISELALDWNSSFMFFLQLSY